MRSVAPDTPEWESMCRQCGICCHETLKVGEVLFRSSRQCALFNAETYRCSKYSERHREMPTCASIEEALKLKSLPVGCPYTFSQTYGGPVEGIMDDDLQLRLEKNDPDAGYELERRLYRIGRGDLIEALYE